MFFSLFLCSKLLGFQHSVMEIWYDEGFDSYAYCNSDMSGEDPNCSDSLLAPISISDHLTYRGIELGTYCDSGVEEEEKVREAENIIDEMNLRRHA